MIKTYKLTHASIKPYGRLIDASYAREMKDGNGWGFVAKVRSSGWRIAYLILRNRSFNRLEMHDSPETFEPIKGRSVLVIGTGLPMGSGPRNRGLTPSHFLLDRPIVLNKGVPHAVYSLTRESHIKIVENISLKTKYIKL